MVGAPSGVMMTDFGRGDHDAGVNIAPPPQPQVADAPAPSHAPSPSVGPHGSDWAALMQQQMGMNTPALQGTLDVASKVNKQSPQFKNTLISMLGGF
jgi:hypothetical protein